MKNRDIKIEYTYKKENDYIVLFFVGGISFFLFLGGLLSFTSEDIITELIVGSVATCCLYYGLKKYKKRDTEEISTNYISFQGIDYKIVKEKK